MDMQARQSAPTAKQTMQDKVLLLRPHASCRYGKILFNSHFYQIRRYRNDLQTLKADLQRANELSERQELYNQNRGGAQYINVRSNYDVRVMFALIARAE